MPSERLVLCSGAIRKRWCFAASLQFVRGLRIVRDFVECSARLSATEQFALLWNVSWYNYHTMCICHLKFDRHSTCSDPPSYLTGMLLYKRKLRCISSPSRSRASNHA